MWYNGYGDIEMKNMGFATSKDGYHWTRYSDTLFIHQDGWKTCVVKHDSLYYVC
jgi:hypothetical protein